MDDLPLLPFKKVLSYLKLRDRLKSRAVSRKWCQMVDSCKVESLCFSEEPIDWILKKHQVDSGVFAQNFISSSSFNGFFKAFGRSIFNYLKHLRLYGLDLQTGTGTAFTRTLNSFVHLEELDLIGKWIPEKNKKQRTFKLNLPMLKSVQFKNIHGIEKLTLNAPVLRKVKLTRCSLSLYLIHGESVETLLIELRSLLSRMKMEGLKNLKHLYVGRGTRIDLPLLFGLDQLKEVHLPSDHDENDVREIFKLKQRYGRTDLKIYRLGYLLDGPGEPAMHFGNLTEVNFPYLAVNSSRLADEIPFRINLLYPAIEGIDPEIQATFLKKLTDLTWIALERKVEDVDRFLNFLQTCCRHITSLVVLTDQPQDLFDRLPDYSVQELNLFRRPFDLEFLFKLKNLMMLDFQFEIDIELVLRALQEFKFLKRFSVSLCKFLEIFIEIPKGPTKSSKLLKVHIDGEFGLETQDPCVVIQFIEQNAKWAIVLGTEL